MKRLMRILIVGAVAGLAAGSPMTNAEGKTFISIATSTSGGTFYAVGGTRNVLLDGLLVLAVFGGLAVPIGHQILKRIVTRQLARKAQQDAAAARQEHS